MKGKKLILAIAVAAIAAPMATAGVDPAPLVSEKTSGLWRAPSSSSPLVSEKTDGLWRAPQSSTSLVSEKTAGLFPAQSASVPVVVVPDSSRFDWSAAAIGAGGTLAFLLAASTGAIAMRRRGMVAH